MTRFAKRRLESGKIKAEQIRATGAKIVVAPCHNCIDQLTELNKEYRLGVEIKTVDVRRWSREALAIAIRQPAQKTSSLTSRTVSEIGDSRCMRSYNGVDAPADVRTSVRRDLSLAGCANRIPAQRYLPHGIDCGVNILFGIERSDAKTDGAVDLVGADLLMHPRSAVQSGTAGDVVVNIQHRAGVGGFETLDIERQHADMVVQIILAVQDHAIDSAAGRRGAFSGAESRGAWMVAIPSFSNHLTPAFKPAIPGKFGVPYSRR